MRTLRACLLIVFAAAASCTPGVYERDVTAVVSGPTTVQVGATVQLNVRLDYSDGTTVLLQPSMMASVEWSSSNTAAATVDRGAVTGVAPGSVTITATPSVTATGTGERIPGHQQMTVQ